MAKFNESDHKRGRGGKFAKNTHARDTVPTTARPTKLPNPGKPAKDRVVQLSENAAIAELLTSAPALKPLTASFYTSATSRHAPTTAERAAAAALTRDWFAKEQNTHGKPTSVFVWLNDRTNTYQLVDETGVQNVWVGRNFDHCRRVYAGEAFLTFRLEDETDLTVLRVDGVDPETFAENVADFPPHAFDHLRAYRI
jgi:hypothetical protein